MLAMLLTICMNCCSLQCNLEQWSQHIGCICYTCPLSELHGENFIITEQHIAEYGQYVDAMCEGWFDFNCDGEVGVADLLLMLEAWGKPYTVDDLLSLLAAWGINT